MQYRSQSSFYLVLKLKMKVDGNEPKVIKSRSLDGVAVNVDPGSRLVLEIVLGLGRGKWGESKLPQKKSTAAPFGRAQCGRGAFAWGAHFINSAKVFARGPTWLREGIGPCGGVQLWRETGKLGI